MGMYLSSSERGCTISSVPYFTPGQGYSNDLQAKDWETDLKKATATAKKSGKYKLVNFTGSDWCGWCIKLDKQVFDKSEFKRYAKKNLIMVKLDFPRRNKLSKKLQKQNDELMKKYAVRGFPTILILNSEGEQVSKTGYKAGGSDVYVEHLKAIIEKDKK